MYGKMVLGTAAILLLLETTWFRVGVRWPPYESAYNRTVKVGSKMAAEKSHSLTGIPIGYVQSLLPPVSAASH